MTKIGFKGTKIEDYVESNKVNDILNFEVEAYDVGSSRGDETLQKLDIGAREVIEIEYENGIVDFLTKEELEERRKNPGMRGVNTYTDPESGDELVWIDELYIADSPERGIKETIVKSIRKFTRKDKLAELTVDAIAQKFDEKNIPNEGLWYCEQKEVGLKERFQARDADTDNPYLLMIHGFASSSVGSFFGFGEANNGSAWKDLNEKYPNRILAYDHKTMTKSPLQNAAELIDVLAPNMVIDVLSYSRGGLVAEILVKACDYEEKRVKNSGGGTTNNGKKRDRTDDFWDRFKELYKSDNEEHAKGLSEELGYIDQIIKGVRDKKIKIRNYVRTACPTGGTTLASNRVVLYLKIILNGIGLIPAVKAFAPYDYLKGFIIAVAEQKGNINTVPGIEALDPQSRFIRGINYIGSLFPITSTPLHVISGDVTFGKFKHTLAVLAADAFFLAKNDLVVNTISMFQGFVRRTNIVDESEYGFYYSFHRDKNVSHFNYFRHKESQNAILIALENKADNSSLFSYYNTQKPFDFSSLRGQVYDKNKPTVIIIPGIMGSHLNVNTNRVWLDIPELIFGGLSKLNYEAEDVHAQGAIGLSYKKIEKYLSDSHNVIIHAFDWRKNLTDQANSLKEIISKELERNDSDSGIRILAHSMGGLLVQAFYSAHKDVWNRLRSKTGFRTIFFGTPFGGSHSIIKIYLKRHKFVNFLSRIDIRNNSDEVLEIINEYVGMLQLLPIDNKNEDYFDLSSWNKIRAASGKKDKFIIPPNDKLEEAKKWQLIIQNDLIEGENLIYVAGKDKLTASRIELNPAKKEIKVIGTVEGDGAVTWETGILPSAKENNNVYYLDVKHGSLLNKSKTFDGIYELMESGTTSNTLFNRAPILSRGGQKEYEMPEVYDTTTNNVTDIQRLLLGDDDEYQERSQYSSTIDINVTHGDLGYAKYPVVVGHFEGDKLMGAEWAINKHLNGQLKENQNLGSYPGELEQSLVLLTKKGLFKGAVVVGLGFNKKLSDKDLERTCIKGLLDLALQGSRRRGTDSEPANNYGISFLVVGSSYGGLNLSLALKAIIRSVIKVNELFSENGFDNIKPFNKLELIELYEDKAIDINKTLLGLKNEPELRGKINVEPYVKDGTAGLSRIVSDSQDSWWHKIQITEEKNIKGISEDCIDKFEYEYALKFTSLSDKARAEIEHVYSNRKLVDILIAQAVKERSWDAEISKTLYELLIPNEFKGLTDDLQNIKIIVDEATAAYPWELLNSTLELKEGPMVVKNGFIRQLMESHYRPNAFYTKEKRAVVICDPIPTEPYQHLPYALAEGQEIKRLLEDEMSYEVYYSQQASAKDVTKLLMARDYKIMHIAGHGEYDKDDPSNSGLILNNGARFTPGEVKQMSSVPDIVFINCCHLGGIDPKHEKSLADRNKFASNLGRQFIKNGVKAVIAAGWAVNDKAAKDFARTFYRQMSLGDDFGTAVKQARRVCYELNKHTITWGAYQCYGNPHYTLGSGSNSWNGNGDSYVHKREVIIEFENIAKSADSFGSRKPIEKTTRIDKKFNALDEKWKDEEEVLNAVAWAYFEIGAYAKAREMYAKVFEKSSLNIDHRSTTNYLMSLTGSIVYDQDNKYSNKEIEGFVKTANELAEKMELIRKHSKVHSVIGGHKKRLLFIETSSNKFETIVKECAAQYEKAYHKIPDNDPESVLYALSNYLIMAEMYELYGGKGISSEDITQLLSDFKEQINALKSRAPKFWQVINHADFAFCKLLSELDSLKTKEEDKITLYMKEVYHHIQSAWDQGGSWRKLMSIIHHYKTMNLILTQILNKKEKVARSKKWHLKKLQEEVQLLLVKLEEKVE